MKRSHHPKMFISTLVIILACQQYAVSPWNLENLELELIKNKLNSNSRIFTADFFGRMINSAID